MRSTYGSGMATRNMGYTPPPASAKRNNSDITGPPAQSASAPRPIFRVERRQIRTAPFHIGDRTIEVAQPKSSGLAMVMQHADELKHLDNIGAIEPGQLRPYLDKIRLLCLDVLPEMIDNNDDLDYIKNAFNDRGIDEFDLIKNIVRAFLYLVNGTVQPQTRESSPGPDTDEDASDSS